MREFNRSEYKSTIESDTMQIRRPGGGPFAARCIGGVDVESRLGGTMPASQARHGASIAFQTGSEMMSYRARIVWIALLCSLSAVNLVVLAVNLSAPSKAAVKGASYQELLRDADFARAVKTIAEQCKVNVELAKLMCQGG
ncbi:hypothetical protein [Bradyrhizobium sp. CB2312]|uniref:hypothetical protein n=1 Tax=Bradyrhizobium sp. CB2312 TaxID=3039155 RepID=UPI0024B15AFA|nr:hypothetical protein [Bradyrhizobium sp. CB2312]WFU75542.1 hypothetical protein QA642_16820 [Bradyrhizobium sp. CB2312]